MINTIQINSMCMNQTKIRGSVNKDIDNIAYGLI